MHSHKTFKNVLIHRFSLKQADEKKMSAEMLYEKSQEQLRKKEEQYYNEMDEKQKLELMLRSLEMELRTLKNHLKQVRVHSIAHYSIQYDHFWNLIFNSDGVLRHLH